MAERHGDRCPLVIVGDSSFAEVAMEMFSAESDYTVVGFAVHAEFRHRSELLGLPVHTIEGIEKKLAPDSHAAFVALTYRELNRARARICGEMKSKGYRLATFISRQAQVWPNVPVGENSFIFENNVVQPFCRIGNNVIIWSGNHIGHHSVVEDNVFIASQVVVSGHCSVGRNSFLGVNATIADGVTIGADNWIGPSSLITKDTAEGEMYRAESTPLSRVGAKRFFRLKTDE